MEELLNILERSLQSGSPLAYLAAFAGGVLGSLTPCVYPLIPITVAYIGSRRVTSRLHGFALSLAYVVGIAVTYAALGGMAALTGKLFGQVAAHPLTQLVVGNVLIVMALSLFDLFALPVPSFLARQGAARRGEIAGAFAFGLVSGLVAGPCTAPVMGALLLFVASQRSVPFGMTLMFTFALGMGAILVLAGTFAGLAARLPRSGRWLVVVKKGFGCILFLAGEYFVMQAGRMLG